MARRARWRSARVPIALLGCVGLLSLAVLSASARAGRPPASASSCSGGGSGGGFFVYGGSGRLVPETNRTVCVTGRLTVTFAGDPATGCAAHGLCGYAGSESWAPGGGGDITIDTSRSHGRRSVTATMIFGGVGNPVRAAVQRSRPNGTTTACSDSSQHPGGFFTLPVSGARVTIALDHAEGALLGSRCAGPLDADIAAALPSRTVSLRALLRGRAPIDLTGGGRFSAHGLAGTVRSTLVLVLGRPHRAKIRHSSPPPGIQRTRIATVSYRVTHLGGSALASVRAAPAAAVCGPFDACGLAGAIDVAPGAAAGGSSVLLSAFAPRRRPERDLLTALGVARGGNPAGIRVVGGGAAFVHGEVVADLTQQGACRDRVGFRQVEMLLGKRRNRLQIALSPATSQAGDPLRTRCPGPELGSHLLISGSVALSVLRRPSFTVALHGGSFSDGPYRVTTRSTVTLTLRRTRIRTRIEP